MIRRFVIAFAVLFVAMVVRAAPRSQAPDFWYVVPDAAHAADANRLVRGIVIPTSVDPTVETSPTGSVLSWQRPDGTRQSFVVQGISSFTFKPGPLKGTTLVPFFKARTVAWVPDTCCTCASWNNMQESMTELTCVTGCQGCGCEACVCTHENPCPHGLVGGMTLVAHNDRSKVMTFDGSGAVQRVAFADRSGVTVEVHGRHLAAEVDANGQTKIGNPDSITIPGRVRSSAAVHGDKATYAWSSPGVAVIAEQPSSLPAPSFSDGTIELRLPQDRATQLAGSRIAMVVDPVRCWVCGHHPNSVPDFDRWECVPGTGGCIRCVSFACDSPQF